MLDTVVASTEFQTRAGLYMERSGKSPVFITKHKRPVRVLLDIDEYLRLKVRDSRRAYFVEELPDTAEWLAAIDVATLDHLTDTAEGTKLRP